MIEQPTREIDDSVLDRAIQEAHLPTLVMSIVHLTGDTTLLDGERPSYAMYDERHRTYSEEARAAIREEARSALKAHLKGRAAPSVPNPTVIQKMMNYIAGADIPAHYVPYLMAELKLDGVDADEPRWNEPTLRQAASAMKVVVIGAGPSGVMAAIRLRQAGIPFLIIEKNEELGGSWFENTYPGCRVDSTNHMYAYSFEADGQRWPMWYSTQPVLLDYFRRAAAKHGIRENIRLNTTVVSMRYDEARSLWSVDTRAADGTVSVLEASAIISAVGQLNVPKFPDIPGRDTFEGASFHSAQWRHDVDIGDKRVAVLGTGASAFQIVPSIASKVGKLSVFQRSPPWIMPTRNYHDPVGLGFQWLLDNVPYYEKWWRFFLFWSFTDGVYDAVRLGPDGRPNEDNNRIREMLTRQMEQQLEGAEHLTNMVIPDAPFGSKRALRDNGSWNESLRRNNVELVSQEVSRIVPAGIETTDGRLHALDVIIFATGFRATEFLESIAITGRDGVTLKDYWAGDARAFLGVAVPKFPNLFMLYGPNTNIVVNGSVILFSECAMHFVMSCLKLAAENQADGIEVRAESYESFNRSVDERNASMAWGAVDARNWYKNAKGRVSQNWPFPVVDYWSATRHAQPEDFILHHRHDVSAKMRTT